MIVIDPPPAGDEEPAGYEALLAAGMRQFGSTENVDPGSVAIEVRPRRRRWFSWALLGSCLLSVKFHAAAAGGIFAWQLLGFLPPSIDLQSRKASIALIASIEAAPDAKDELKKPVRPVTIPKPKPPEPKPEPKREAVEIVKTVTEREPTKRRESKHEEVALAEPETPQPNKKQLDEEPEKLPDEPLARSKRPAPNVAPLESAASMASLEVEGSQFDEFPQDFYNPKPPYPADAYSRRQEGVVLLRLRISATGIVEDAEVLQSSGVPSLDDAAVRTVLTWRFHPARLLGRNVAATVKKPVRFTYQDGA
ncbi:MAG: energy transducer TonB [Planctomycetales bacterium]|nr:energy transducer TonB [Planctomycetales bacterium]MBN8624446.1 energy transducer TonB [Planctomycetota bacterium]